MSGGEPQKSFDAKVKSGQAAKKYMFVRLNNSHFAIPLSSVREVLGLTQLSPVPNMPSYFAGLINLRGKIVSAIHLNRSLNFLSEASNSTRRPCVVITEVDGRLFGAIVDEVVEVAAVDSESTDFDVSEIASSNFFSGVIKRVEKPLAPILNLESAFRLSEMLKLESKYLAAG
jgi:purine-binding chemotaxis protein CheW